MTARDTATYPVRVEVNGSWREGSVEPRRTLADFLREDLDLTGTHLACEHGFCGNCNVLLDGQTRALVPDARRAGRRPRGRDGRGPRRPRRHAERAPAGVHRQPRPAVRVLHAGHADDRGRVHARASRGRQRRRDPRGDQRRHLPLHRLPADRRVDPGRIAGGRRPPRSREVRDDHRAGSERREGRARHRRRRGRHPPLARQEHQPRRGSPLPARRGPLHRRHQAAGHGARGDRPQPARAREDPRDPHRGGRAAARRDRRRDGQGRRRARQPPAVVRRRADHPGHDRDREGAPLRRDASRPWSPRTATSPRTPAT